MSKLSQLRKKWNYETNVPRCSTCDAFVHPYVYLKTDSLTGKSQPLCKRGQFTVAPNACCDKWTHKGQVLAGLAA